MTLDAGADRPADAAVLRAAQLACERAERVLKNLLEKSEVLRKIRAGKPVNNVPQSVDSTLTGILGQMAAHQQRMVTWEEMIRSAQRYEFKPAG